MIDKTKKAAVAVGVTVGTLVALCGAPLWGTILGGVGGAVATIKLIDKTAA